MKTYTAWFRVKNKNTGKVQDLEDATVSTDDKVIAEKEVRTIIDNFNNTLRPGEDPREFFALESVDVIEPKQEEENDDDGDDFDDDDYRDQERSMRRFDEDHY